MLSPNVYPARPEVAAFLRELMNEQYPEAIRHLMGLGRTEDGEKRGCGCVSLSIGGFEYLVVRLKDGASWSDNEGIGYYIVGQYPHEVPSPGWRCGRQLLMRAVVVGNIGNMNLAAYAAKTFGDIIAVPVTTVHFDAEGLRLGDGMVYVSSRLLEGGTGA